MTKQVDTRATWRMNKNGASWKYNEPSEEQLDQGIVCRWPFLERREFLIQSVGTISRALSRDVGLKAAKSGSVAKTAEQLQSPRHDPCNEASIDVALSARWKDGMDFWHTLGTSSEPKYYWLLKHEIAPFQEAVFRLVSPSGLCAFGRCSIEGSDE